MLVHNMLKMYSAIAFLTNQYLMPTVQSPNFAAVVNENAFPGEVVYLLNNQSSWDIRPLISQLHQPVIVANNRTRWNNKHAELWYPPYWMTAFTVVLCEHLWQCYHLLSNQVERHLINPRQRVLVQLVEEVINQTELPPLLEEIFRGFRRLNLMNVVIGLGFGCKLEFFTFSPFEKTFLVNLTDSSHKVGEAEGLGASTTKLYSDKVKNMHRHPFRMSLFESPPYLVNFSKSDAVDDQFWIGYDGGMVRAIVKHFNATLQLVVPDNNDPGYEIFYNSSAAFMNGGATEDVVMDRSDMVINTRPFDPSFLIEYLYPHYFNHLSIFLPKASRRTLAKNGMAAFAWDARVVIICIIIAVLLLNYCLHKKQSSSKSSWLEILAYFLQHSFTSSRQYSTIHRVVLVTWSIFTLVIVSVITGRMFSDILLVRYHPDIDTLHDLMLSGYQIPITRERYSLVELFNKNNSKPYTARISQEYWDLMPQFLIFETRQEIFELVEQNQRYAFMHPTGYCEYFVARKQFQAADGGPVYHLLKEIVLPDMGVQIVQYGSPYLVELNKLLMWFREAGLDLNARRRLEWKINQAHKGALTSAYSLKYHHVSHCFQLLAIGIGVALGTFLVELGSQKFYCVNYSLKSVKL